MTTTASTTRSATQPVSPPQTSAFARRHARAAGLFYLLTFASSIPALLLIAPVLDDPSYVLGAGQDDRVLLGSLLDVVNALTAVGTAVAVFPVVKRVNEAFALGFVMSRMFEAAVIMTGVVSLLAVVTLRQDLGGTDASGLTTTAQALVDVRDWTFLFGPGVMAAINALLFGTLLLRSGLVPRWMPTLGLVGAPVLLTVSVLVVFGVMEQVSGTALLLTLPIATWEFSVGTYMLVKGFRPTPYSID